MSQIALLAVVVGLVGGAVALAMLALMVTLSSQSWVIDSADSHGISELQSSRLGGVAVFLGTILFFWVFEWTKESSAASLKTIITSAEQLPSYATFSLMIALVGLWDDFVSRFSPIARLTLVILIALSALVTNAVPMSSNSYNWLPLGLNNSMFLTIAGTLIVAGFVNAGNMADGANGLLSVIGISFLSVSVSFDGLSLSSMLIMPMLIFFIFNVATSRIFLGDFGAYGLSALIAFGSLELYSRGLVSVWFLGSLLAYPCVEMVRVIVLRRVGGRSPFQAANDHSHNYLYELMRKRSWNNITANSATGCFWGFLSSFFPAFLYLSGAVDATSSLFWFCYFAIYLMLHLWLAAQLERALNEE